MSASIFKAFDNRGVMAFQYLSGAKVQAPPALQNQNSLGSNQQIARPPQLLNYDSLVMEQIPGGNNNPGMAGLNMRGMGQNAFEQFQGNNDGGLVRQRAQAQRNPSIISFGGRNMSFASDYGRSMSGLSALSIDWENMEDFDVNVDHSAHINNSNGGMNPPGDIMIDPRPLGAGGVGGGARGRRSSIQRQSFMMGNAAAAAAAAVASSNDNNSNNND